MLMFCVVTEPCRDCRYTDCVTVCPVDAFYQDDRMLYIDPETCIGCGACAPECPVEAIFDDDAVPSQWASYIQLNLERTRELKMIDGTNITERQEPLAGAHCKPN
jgi:ferredoxin